MKRFHTLPVLLFCIYVVVLPCLHAAAQAPPTLRVNAQRIHEHLSALSKFGANPQGVERALDPMVRDLEEQKDRADATPVKAASRARP